MHALMDQSILLLVLKCLFVLFFSKNLKNSLEAEQAHTNSLISQLQEKESSSK